MLSCRDMAPWLSTHSPTAPRGGRWWHQPPKGDCISSPAGRLYGFRRQRRHKKMAPERAPTSPAQRYYITPEGESPQPACKASADHRQNPGSPGPKGPAASSTLTPVRACQPSGILESTAQVPVPTAPQAPEPSFKNSGLYLTSRISLRRLLFPLLLWFFLLS